MALGKLSEPWSMPKGAFRQILMGREYQKLKGKLRQPRIRFARPTEGTSRYFVLKFVLCPEQGGVFSICPE